jgi:nucleoside-diphosphate-sugar epimerase
MHRLLITGAGSLAGDYLRGLLDPAWTVIWVGRHRPVQLPAHCNWQPLDLEGDDLRQFKADAIMHLAPLPLIAKHLQHFPAMGVARLVAIGTTSRFTKIYSESSKDRNMVRDQVRAECDIAESCGKHGVAWTLLRPTLVYDGRRDRNVAAIAHFIERFGIFPVIGSAQGLRQPLHARDLAAACVAVLDNRRSWNKAYNLAGAECLSYRSMIERIFAALGKRPHFIRIPRWGFRTALRCAAWHPRYRHLTAAMADRMNQDMVFALDDAVRDFGFTPRRFQPDLR